MASARNVFNMAPIFGGWRGQFRPLLVWRFCGSTTHDVLLGSPQPQPFKSRSEPGRRFAGYCPQRIQRRFDALSCCMSRQHPYLAQSDFSMISTTVLLPVGLVLTLKATWAWCSTPLRLRRLLPTAICSLQTIRMPLGILLCVQTAYLFIVHHPHKILQPQYLREETAFVPASTTSFDTFPSYATSNPQSADWNEP